MVPVGCIGLLHRCNIVPPYEHATMAELYLVLRQQAIEKNLCTSEELMLDLVLPDDGFREF